MQPKASCYYNVIRHLHLLAINVLIDEESYKSQGFFVCQLKLYYSLL